MSKIIIKHSSIVINDYNMGDSAKLEYFFRLYDKITHSYYFKGLEYIEETKTLILPRGIDIYFLEGIFNATSVVDYGNDKFERTRDIMIKYLPKDETQKTALRFIIGEGEYRFTKQKSQLSVNLNTGAGKTYVTIATMAYERVKTAVITSSLDWLDQWRNRIQEYTDITGNEIYMLSGTASIAKLLNGMKDVSKIAIFLISHNTIKSYGDNYGWNKVSELFQIMSIGMKVYDEAHLNFDNMCKIDYYTNTRKTLYLTATPARSDEDENDLYKLYFKNIPAIDLFDEESDPRTKYIALHYNSRPNAKQVHDCRNQYGLNRNAYTEYVVKNQFFHNVMHILIGMIKKSVGKTLIYIGINKSIEEVRDWIIENYPNMEEDIGIYTSMITENKEAQLNKKIILSTTKSCGAAMDIPDLKMTVVLAEPFKSEVLARQTLGRTRKSNTLYIEVVDHGFNQIKKYYTYKKPIFAKYATECVDIKLSDLELREKSKQVHEKYSNLPKAVIHHTKEEAE